MEDIETKSKKINFEKDVKTLKIPDNFSDFNELDDSAIEFDIVVE